MRNYFLILLILFHSPPAFADSVREELITQISSQKLDINNNSTYTRYKDINEGKTIELSCDPTIPYVVNLEQKRCFKSLNDPTLPSVSLLDEKKFQALEPCAEVEGIRVIGCTILKSEIGQIIQPYAGGILTKEDQLNLRDKITLIYIQKGFITSRATLNNVEQPIVDGGGVVGIEGTEIYVVEGTIDRENIKVEVCEENKCDAIDAKLLEDRPALESLESYIRDRLRSVVSPKLLNANDLEKQLRLLNNDPSFENIEPILKRSAERDQSRSELLIKVREAKFFNFSANINNFSPPSIGSEKLELNLRIRSLSNLDRKGSLLYGDELSLSTKLEIPIASDLEEKKILQSIFDSFGVAYITPPITSSGSKIQLSGNFNWDEVVQKPFSRSNIRAESQIYNVGYLQPIIRNFREEFALSLDFTFQKGQTLIFNTVGFPFGIGPDEDGISRTSVISLGAEYIRRDVSGRGRWLFGTRLNFGTSLFDATRNSGSTPDGQFVSLLSQLQRVQNLGAKNLLVAQFDFQVASDSLLPSQQFAIGGQSLRGYRQNVRSGDNGFRFSVENRISVIQKPNPKNLSVEEPTLQVIPFADVGMIWNNSGNPNELPNQNLLASIGLGVLWQISPNTQLRLDYAFPLVELEDRGRNLQDSGIHFRLSYSL